MSKQPSVKLTLAKLVRALVEDPQARVRKTADDEFILVGSMTVRPRKIESAMVADLLASGLPRADHAAAR